MSKKTFLVTAWGLCEGAAVAIARTGVTSARLLAAAAARTGLQACLNARACICWCVVYSGSVGGRGVLLRGKCLHLLVCCGVVAEVVLEREL